MRSSWVSAAATLATGLSGLAWLALFVRQPMLGFEDTDDPAVGVAFVQAHPEVFAQTGLALILMSVTLTIAVASVADLHEPTAPRWAVVATSAAGMFAALCFLVFGAMRIGASGPLLHIAGIRPEWGEMAYLAVQMAGVQGVLPAGMFALAAWAVGLSLIGLRWRTIPLIVSVLGIVPALHVLGRLLGGIGELTESLWFIAVASIPGTMLWCVGLGIGLTVRRVRAGRAASKHA